MASFSEGSGMLDLLREEARFSNEMRRRNHMAPNETAIEDDNERKPPEAVRKEGDIRVAAILVGLLTAAWLTLEYNYRLAEEFPAAAPLIESFRDTALDIAERATALFARLEEQFPNR